MASFSSILSGLISGGLSGAGTGTTFAPGIGTAIGAGIGALGGGLASGLSDRSQRLSQQSQGGGLGMPGTTGLPENISKLSNFSEPQQQFQNQVLQMMMQNLGPGGPLEQQANQRFAQQILPGISERLTALGAGGGRSSAYDQFATQAGANLQSDINAQKMNQLFGLSQFGMQSPYNYLDTTPAPGIGVKFAEGAGKSLPELLKVLAPFLKEWMASKGAAAGGGTATGAEA